MSDDGERDVAAILRERAEKLAARTSGEAVVPGRRMLVLRVGDDPVALPAVSVEEALPLPRVVRLPGLPGWIRGVVVHRGEPISVIDLAPLLGKPTGERPTVLVVVRGARGCVGIVAHALLGLRDIADSEQSPDLLISEGAGGGLVELVTRDLVSVLDLERMLSDPRIASVVAR